MTANPLIEPTGLLVLGLDFNIVVCSMVGMGWGWGREGKGEFTRETDFVCQPILNLMYPRSFGQY